jgi:hypothetical protein
MRALSISFFYFFFLVIGFPTASIQIDNSSGQKEYKKSDYRKEMNSSFFFFVRQLTPLGRKKTHDMTVVSFSQRGKLIDEDENKSFSLMDKIILIGKRAFLVIVMFTSLSFYSYKMILRINKSLSPSIYLYILKRTTIIHQ